MLYQWAWALTDLGKLAELTALFQRLHKEYPQSRYWADATCRLLDQVFTAKQYGRARELVGVLLAAKPEPRFREHAMLTKGQIEFAERKWKEAKEAFQMVVAEFPNSPSKPIAELGIAQAMFCQGDALESEDRFRQLAKAGQRQPAAQRAVVQLRLAQSLCQQGKWKQALAVASKIEKEFPNFEEQYEADFVVGRCLAQEAEYEAAREAYRKVIHSKGNEKSETAAEAQLMIAESYFHQKDYAAALREYFKVESLYAYPPEQAASLLQAGKCHEFLGEWKEATEVYRQLVEKYSSTTSAKEGANRLRIAQQEAANSR